MSRYFPRDEHAVSPVIASLILVSTVIVASAGVYLYAQNFSNEVTPTPKSLALTSASPLDGSVKTYTVPSATPQMLWSDIIVRLDGVVQNQDVTAACPAPTGGTWIGCTASTTAGPSNAITAGDTFKIYAASGQTLRITDVGANSLILSVVIQ